MNGTPTVSWLRLCAIDRVKLPNQVSKVREIPIPRNQTGFKMASFRSNFAA